MPMPEDVSIRKVTEYPSSSSSANTAGQEDFCYKIHYFTIYIPDGLGLGYLVAQNPSLQEIGTDIQKIESKFV